jgi:predicted acetyltransferase
LDKPPPTRLQLVWPAREHLASYRAALDLGWSPNNLRPEAGREELAQIELDADAFLATLVDVEGKGAPVKQPNGSVVPRLPGYRKWLWDGDFCGSIGFRWQKGSNALPPYCLGHIGYAVVPWKRRNGYATQALALLLKEALAQGLTYVEITTDPDNLVSQRVILANGGVLVEKFVTPAEIGHKTELRWRIDL